MGCVLVFCEWFDLNFWEIQRIEELKKCQGHCQTNPEIKSEKLIDPIYVQELIEDENTEKKQNLQDEHRMEFTNEFKEFVTNTSNHQEITKPKTKATESKIDLGKKETKSTLQHGCKLVITGKKLLKLLPQKWKALWMQKMWKIICTIRLLANSRKNSYRRKTIWVQLLSEKFCPIFCIEKPWKNPHRWKTIWM